MENCLRDLRNSAGDTQQDLADAMGVSRQTVISIESGRYNPSLELALHLAARYGTAIERIFRHDPDCALCHPAAPALPDGQLPAPAAAA